MENPPEEKLIDCAGPCHEQKAESEFYRHTSGTIRSICKYCFNSGRRDRVDRKTDNPFTKLTDAKQKEIKDSLAAGNNMVTTAELTGIKRATLGYWKKRGYLA